MEILKNLIVIKSIAAFWKQLMADHSLRSSLFNDSQTPKQAFSFLFFIVMLGQVGILTSIIFSTISGNGFFSAIATQGASGNFLTFEISLIFSCAMLYFQEYGEEKTKKLFCLRVTYLILGLSIAFLSMLNYIYISTSNQNNTWSMSFITYNISPYILGIFISYKIYTTFSVAEETIKEFNERKTSEAVDRAETLKNTQSIIIDGQKIDL